MLIINVESVNYNNRLMGKRTDVIRTRMTRTRAGVTGGETSTTELQSARREFAAVRARAHFFINRNNWMEGSTNKTSPFLAARVMTCA